MANNTVDFVYAGQVLAGKYRIERVLGVGGMGAVVAARHLRLDESVAIKLLKPELTKQPIIVERFVREARASLRIKSDNVVRVMDVDVLEDGTPYMVMEMLDGWDLNAHVKSRGAMHIAEAATYLIPVCEALAEAHVGGIVHRNLKPANIFLTKRGGDTVLVKILDFGISKLNESVDGGMTGTQAVLGSPYYMSPEQMMSPKTVDARSDIWSLGIILYQLLTAKLPFAGETLPEICVAVVNKDPEPLASLRPDLPAEVHAVVARCIAKDRNFRYANVAEVAAALAPYGPPGSDRSVDRAARLLNVRLNASAPPNRSIPPGAMTFGGQQGYATGPGITGPGITGPGITGPGITGPGITGPGITGPGLPGQGPYGGQSQSGVVQGIPGAVGGGTSYPGASYPGVGVPAGSTASGAKKGGKGALVAVVLAILAVAGVGVVLLTHMPGQRGKSAAASGTAASSGKAAPTATATATSESSSDAAADSGTPSATASATAATPVAVARPAVKGGAASATAAPKGSTAAPTKSATPASKSKTRARDDSDVR